MVKTMQIRLLKALVNTIGRTSDGIRMSFEYGFISGKMLDYIYANKPSGRFVIGKFIDWCYLSHPGWKAIRQRKDNLMASLEEAIRLARDAGTPVRLLDVASGPAQYIVDTMKKFGAGDVRALCRDYDSRWVDEGRRKAVDAGLKDIRFEQGDAFDEQSFAEIAASQDVAVASGFYDWIVDDEMVKKSMRNICSALRTGGFFVFTNQSGHVDLSMVEAIFVDFNRKPLRMKTRSADLMNTWACEAGFCVMGTASDEHGYYSVTLARKE